MANSYFLGTQTTDNWGTDERPENWRQGIMYRFPNGRAPLTAMTSMASTEPVDDPVYHWWTQGNPEQKAEFTAGQVFNDSALSSAYTSGAVKGTVLYVKVTLAEVSEFRPGHMAMFSLATTPNLDTVGKVVEIKRNAASSYVAVQLLEIDDNASGDSKDLSDATILSVIGDVNAEGAQAPDAINILPSKHDNKTQIFRTPLDITGTARSTTLRTEDAYKKKRRDALHLHGLTLEKAHLWGIKSEEVGDNGKPERTSQGIISWIREKASDHVDHYTTSSADAFWASKTWKLGGEAFLDFYLERVFRFGADTLVALMGSGALLNLKQLVDATGGLNFGPGLKVFGMKLLRWETPFGDILLKTHPLMNTTAKDRNSMIVFDPAQVGFRPLKGRDTHFRAAGKVNESGYGDNSIDGTKEEWLTEGGFQYDSEDSLLYLTGLGTLNTV